MYVLPYAQTNVVQAGSMILTKISFKERVQFDCLTSAVIIFLLSLPNAEVVFLHSKKTAENTVN